MTPDSPSPLEPPVPTAADAARLVTHLAQARPGHRRIVAPQELAPEVALLRHFQSQRLAQTHADLLASPRFSPAATVGVIMILFGAFFLLSQFGWVNNAFWPIVLIGAGLFYLIRRGRQ